MNRTDYLTSILDSLKRPEYGELRIEFKPFTGWMLRGESRWFGDEGDYLGANWREAEEALRWLLNAEPELRGA